MGIFATKIKPKLDPDRLGRNATPPSPDAGHAPGLSTYGNVASGAVLAIIVLPDKRNYS